MNSFKRIGFSLFVIMSFIMSCSAQKETNMEKQANHLITETSPYLLQHAYNPVEWYPWGEEALKKAKEENKIILLSIGYSACHWCHVMEHESFEDTAVANLMNKHFVCIKVDREERPDIDDIYMGAVQKMGLGGGWPLNVFITPEQKPFYGGTYFPKKKWTQVLEQLADVYHSDPERVFQSANKITASLQASELDQFNQEGKEVENAEEYLGQVYSSLSKKFDKKLGGSLGAPKFPMPTNYLFLQRYTSVSKDKSALSHLTLTLDKMAQGGIYDQLLGGFARYSTDEKWFAPHFEKMLYDNGQLLSLYATAYQQTGQLYYKQIVFETINWLSSEMLDKDNGYYAALDADSEGEEGKFYVWTFEEIKTIFPKDYERVSEYFSVKKAGSWEHGNNILTVQTDEVATKEQKQWKTTLLKERNKRIRPGLDDKKILAWNALVVSGLCDAYNAFQEKDHLQQAVKTVLFIEEKMQFAPNQFYHTYKNGQGKSDAFLDDLALLVKAYIDLHQSTLDAQWLIKAVELTAFINENYFDGEEGLYFYTANNSETLITRKKELFDNVIPSSNSVMANNLYDLSVLLGRVDYEERSVSMLTNYLSILDQSAGFLSNWATLFTKVYYPSPVMVISGGKKEVDKVYNSVKEAYLPQAYFLVANEQTREASPLVKGKEREELTFYVCFKGTCKQPVTSLEEALKQLN